MYLLYVYSKWQMLDLYNTLVNDLLFEGLLTSPRNLGIVLGSIGFYALFLAGIVRFLRRESLAKIAQRQQAEERERRAREE